MILFYGNDSFDLKDPTLHKDGKIDLQNSTTIATTHYDNGAMESKKEKQHLHCHTIAGLPEFCLVRSVLRETPRATR